MTGELNLDAVGPGDASNLRRRAQQYLFPAPLDRPVLVFVIFLFSLDALLIVLHMLMVALNYLGFDVEGSGLTLFSVQRDGGIPEVFNYFQLGIVSVVLTQIYTRSRVTIYLILALFFVYALFDDALQLHEQMGEVIAAALALPDMWGIVSADIGQLLYFAIVGAVVVPMLWGGWVNTNPAHRGYSTAIIAMICALAFFAVFVDFVHVFAAGYSRVANQVLALIEDGGEMLVVTASCWVAFSILKYVSHER